jgi:hypothetical protein
LFAGAEAGARGVADKMTIHDCTAIGSSSLGDLAGNSHGGRKFILNASRVKSW